MMSHKKINDSKRHRSSNVSYEEKELLLKIALEKKNILENKCSNASSWKYKNTCWLHITEMFNSATTGCVRKKL